MRRTCLGDVVLVEVIVPGPPLTAAGHLTELSALLLASNVVTLANLQHCSQCGPWSGPYLGSGVHFTQLAGPVPTVAT